MRQHAPEAQQIAFGLEVIKRYGFDFERGRQDKTHHPFMTKFSLGDVRITTRYIEDDFAQALLDIRITRVADRAPEIAPPRPAARPR